MTVKTLIKKLLDMPMYNKVIFTSTDLFKNGGYEVTGLYDADDGTVVLDSNYKKNYWEDKTCQ